MATSTAQQEPRNEPSESTYLLRDPNAPPIGNHQRQMQDFPVFEPAAISVNLPQNGGVDEACAKRRTRKEVLVSVYLLGVCFVVLLTTHGILKLDSWSYAIVFTPVTVLLYLSLYYAVTFREEAENFLGRYFSLSFIRISFLVAVTLFFATYMMLMLNFCTMDLQKSAAHRHGKINWYLAVTPLIAALMFGLVGIPLYILVHSLLGKRGGSWLEQADFETAEQDFHTRDLSRILKFVLVMLFAVCSSCSLLLTANFFMRHYDSSFQISWCFAPLYIFEFFALSLVVTHETCKLVARRCNANRFMRWLVNSISREEDQPWFVAIMIVVPGAIFSQAALGLFGLLGSSVFLSLLIPWTFASLYVWVLLRREPTEGTHERSNSNPPPELQISAA